MEWYTFAAILSLWSIKFPSVLLTDHKLEVEILQRPVFLNHCPPLQFTALGLQIFMLVLVLQQLHLMGAFVYFLLLLLRGLDYFVQSTLEVLDFDAVESRFRNARC